MNNLQNILEKLLKELGYSENLLKKTIFDLNELIILESYDALIDKLDIEKQKEFQLFVEKNKTDIKLVHEFFKKSYTDEQIQNQITKTSLDVTSDYIINLLQNSSSEKKDIIQKYLSSIP